MRARTYLAHGGNSPLRNLVRLLFERILQRFAAVVLLLHPVIVLPLIETGRNFGVRHLRESRWERGFVVALLR